MKNSNPYTLEKVNDERIKIKAEHDEGCDGRDTSLSLTILADSTVNIILNELEVTGVVIGAIGGFGRCQLSPNSDLDLITIYDKKSDKNEKKISEMVRSLWDLGWSVSHSYLTLDEVKVKSETDLDFLSSLLDFRTIHPDELLGKKINYSIQIEIFPPGLERIFSMKLEETKRRHERFGLTSRMLEPNIKESAGGLRDVHSLIWINMNLKILARIEDNKIYPRVDTYLNLIAEKEGWHPGLTKRLIEANDLILKIRHEIHYLKDEKNDFLTFDIRDKVASNLIKKEDGQSVQLFLRNYYKSARNISKALKHSEEVLTDTTKKLSYVTNKPIKVQSGINSDGNKLYLDPETEGKFDYGLINVLELFLYSKENNCRISSVLLYQIDKHYLEYKPTAAENKGFSKIFFRLFNNSKNLALILRQLFEAGILKSMIPELDEIYCHAPKSKYHYYTTDEHTMKALEVLEKLDNSEGIDELQQVMQKIKCKNELLVSLLFHDISKPGETIEGQHVTEGAEITRRILQNFGYQGDIDLIERLILNHLAMEQTAFRRDISLIETVEKFCMRVKDKLSLDCLYLLTYADLYSVNPTVWSEWKKSLLSNLYKKSSDFLNGYYKNDLNRENTDLMDDLKIIHGTEKVKSILAMLPLSYQHEFDSRQISEHISIADKIKADDVSVSCRSLYNYSEATILAADRKYLLSDICAVFAVNNVSIFGAKIYTRTDGIAIDNFHVVSSKEKKPLLQETINDLNDDLLKVLKNEIEIEKLFERHNRRWKWKFKDGSEIPIRVEFDESEIYSIIDITGSDYLGLLHSITRALSKCKIVIYSAKISTKEDGLIDSFYVLDSHEKKIGLNVTEKEIRKSIYEQVKNPLLKEISQA